MTTTRPTIHLPQKNGPATVFGVTEGGELYLQRLWGLVCGVEGRAEGHGIARQLVSLTADGRRREAAEFATEHIAHDASSVRLTLALRETPLRIDIRWSAHPETGMLCRVDTIRNTGSRPARITSVAARFVLTPGRYEVRYQDSQWGTENIMRRQELDASVLELGCHGGRTALQSTPYLFLRDLDDGLAVAFHILPQGNWRIRVQPSTCHLQPEWQVDLGLQEGNLCRELAPGQSWSLPEILVQSLPGLTPQSGAPALHRYLLASEPTPRKRDLPFVYNSWGDVDEHLDLPRLRRQLAVAREVGCEVFVVDAGWYGMGEESWFNRVGDWRERSPQAFGGRMSAFADEVRHAGLGFGLWMEPERLACQVPIIAEHPEWFLPTPAGGLFPDRSYRFPDLCQQGAYDWVKGEIAAVIQRYRPVWLKFDANTELGDDGTELNSYFRKWDQLMAELRASYPQIVFEGCAAGGLRSELKTVQRFDCNHISDSANPVDMLRIYSAGLIRLPAGNASAWIVLQPCTEAAGRGEALTAGPVVTGRQTLVDPEFAAAVALLGVTGLSGDLAGLAPALRSRLAAAIARYKTYRNWIRESVAHLLTPLPEGQQPATWTAIQFECAAEAASLLFVFRMNGVSKRWFRLMNLDPLARYRLEELTGAEMATHEAGGHELMNDGFGVHAPRPFSAQIWRVENVSTKRERAK